MLRADVATFGKASDSDEDGIPAGADQLHVAEAALRDESRVPSFSRMHRNRLFKNFVASTKR